MFSWSGQGNTWEFQIHRDPAGDQQRVQAAQLQNGNLVFAYENQEEKFPMIFLRLLELNPLGGIWIEIPSKAGNAYLDPVVASLNNELFVVAFTVRDVEGSGDSDVYYQLFQSNGEPATEAGLAHLSNVLPQSQPRIAVLGELGFVIAFADLRGSDQDIYYRRFDLRGDPIDKTEIAANLLGNNAVNRGDQGGHDVSGFDDGGFVLVFEDRNTEHVFGIQFNPSGDPVPTRGLIPDQYQFQVDPGGLPAERAAWAPRVSVFPRDRDYVVAYNTEVLGKPESRAVRARIFTGPGSGGEEFEGGNAEMRQQDPDVQALPDRSMIFGWQARPAKEPGLGWSVWIYPREISGPHDIPGFPAAPDALYSRDRVDLARLFNGGFVMAWESKGQDRDGDGVYARLVAPLEPAHGMLSIARSSASTTPRVGVGFIGAPYECYQLQATVDFSDWSTVLTTNPPSGRFEYTIPLGPGNPARHFRVERKLFFLAP